MAVEIQTLGVKAQPAVYTMNVWSVTSLGIGSMVGAGIFALLGQVALCAGHDTYLAFLVGGIVAGFSGYSYAKLAARYPEAGGIVDYFEQAFGTTVISGTLSLIYLLTLVVTVAMVAKAFGAYGARLFLNTGAGPWINVLASTVVVLLAILNLANSNLVGKAELVMVFLKLLILAVLMIAGLSMPGVQHLTEHIHPSFFNLVSSAGLTFFAYAGFGMMANAAASVAKPQITIPRAIYLAIGTVGLLYVGLAMIVLRSISPAELVKNADTAVATAAQPILGRAGFVAVSVAALLATTSAINATLFSTIKISGVMGDSGQLPRLFIRPIWRLATQGVVLCVGAMLLLIDAFELNAIANIASAMFLFTYLAVHVAHWRVSQLTGGSKAVIGIGFLLMAAVLTVFLWTVSRTQPWSLAIVVIVIAASAMVSTLILRSRIGTLKALVTR